MKRSLKLVAVVAVLGVVAAACGGGDEEPGPGQATETAGGDLSGGTLRMAQVADVDAAFDPQKSYYSVTWSYYRVILRRLMYYPGLPGAEGTVPQPDLAAADPEVSEDGLTWTFTLKDGIMYAPPKQDVEITAPDFIRALEREANPKANVGGYSFYYSPIVGFDEFAEGKAESISGLSAPDDKTLVVELTKPSGLQFLMALPASAPIPPDDPGERMGVAEGHDKDYGRYLVASGPYMFEGGENVDFSVDAKDQDTNAGYIPGRSIVLVRNPSWDPATDELRPAYPDRIEVTIGGDNDDLFNRIAANELDFVVDGIVPPDRLREYSTNPDLQDRLDINVADGVRYISMNLLVPPFDDIYVRRAFNFLLDKQGMRQLRGGPSAGEIAGHVFLNSHENDLLADYDPFATPDSAGDIELAKQEMAQSKYDSDGDGVCDDPVCDGVLAVTDREDPYPKQAALFSPALEEIGITLDIKQLERTVMYNNCNDLNSHFGVCLGPGWLKDFPDAFTFASPLFGSDGLWPSCCNYSGLGATEAQIKEWGYSGVEVPPSVDADVEACDALLGDARAQCWADLDRKIMEEIVPWVIYLFDNSVDLISENVVNHSYDQDTTIQAYDHFALADKA